MSSSQPVDPWLERRVGDRDRYRLDRRLGSGGMADVFLAVDTLLGQPVALKLLHEKLAVGEMRGRFEREVALCAALRSNHIVQVSDHGVTREGNPFFVMEYLRGQTLRQLLARERYLSVDRTVSLITQVCMGLQLAHQGVDLCCPGAACSEHVKIVHRDLKPDNIFLVSTALGEWVKILDFGIAQIRSDQINPNATSVFLGTYRYAAPEQFEVGKPLDERADLYSLGIILYEMLSGTDPFGFGDTAYPLSGGTWAVAHTSKEVLPLRQQVGCEQLSPELESVVMQCLHKQPEQRFVSVTELNSALQAAVARSTAIGQISSKFVDTALSDTALSNTALSNTASDTASSETAPTASAPLMNAALPWSDPSTPSETADLITHKVGLTPITQTVTSKMPSAAQPFAKSTRPRALIPAGVATVLLLGLGLYSASQGSSRSQQQHILESAGAPQIAIAGSMVPASSALKTLSGHSDTVWTVAISPDGKTLVSGGSDKTIKIWNLQTGNLRRTLTGHTDAVRAIAMSQDGALLASASGDKTIKIWDLQSGTLLRTLTGHLGPVWSVAIGSDGQTLASGSYDSTVKIWSLQTGTLRHTFPEHYESIWSVAISPDGQTLVSAAYDGTIKIWDLQTGDLRRTLASGNSEAIRSVAISPDGQTLVSGSWDKTVKIWNLQTGELLHTLVGHSDRVLSVAISPTGETIASGSLDRTIKLWDLKTGLLLRTLAGHSDWVVSVAFSPDAKTLASASKDKTIKIWDVVR